MVVYDKLALELVSIWVEKSAGSQESFGYIISLFLKDNPLIATTVDVEKVLSASKVMAGQVVLQHPEDIPLHLSHKAFTSALDNFINCLN